MTDPEKWVEIIMGGKSRPKFKPCCCYGITCVDCQGIRVSGIGEGGVKVHKGKC